MVGGRERGRKDERKGRGRKEGEGKEGEGKEKMKGEGGKLNLVCQWNTTSQRITPDLAEWLLTVCCCAMSAIVLSYCRASMAIFLICSSFV